MRFDHLFVAEPPKNYLNTAFHSARNKEGGGQTPLTKARSTARAKIQAVEKSLCKVADRLVHGYPTFDQLPPIYAALCQTQLPLGKVKASLGRIQGLGLETQRMTKRSVLSLAQAKNAGECQRLMKSYYGRINSLWLRSANAFTTLEDARKVMRTFPDIKEYYTVALAGLPNVGKSTLLATLTSSTPKIADYSFTTTSLNLGTFQAGLEKIQVIDTPGTLGRVSKRNAIEKQAELVLHHVCQLIVFIIDPTSVLVNQLALLAQVKKERKPIILFLSKSDIASEQAMIAARNAFPKSITEAAELRAEIIARAKAHRRG